ncbi:MAG: hypothetical protein ACREJN_18190 [Nitrospiraceae bacterium]
MRVVVTTICALTLAGCASSLPYSIASGDPKESIGRAGREQCVLRLDDVVATVVENGRSLNWTIKTLQIEFETALHKSTQGLEHCTDSKGHPVQVEDTRPIEAVSKKWLTSYALDATDPDQNLDRFHEYLRSAQLVQDLASQQLLPDEDACHTYHLVENIRARQSQWCGSLTMQVFEPILPSLLSPARADQPHTQQTRTRTERDEKDVSIESPCL